MSLSGFGIKIIIVSHNELASICFYTEFWKKFIGLIQFSFLTVDGANQWTHVGLEFPLWEKISVTNNTFLINEVI